MATYSLSPLFNGWQGFNAAGQPLNLGTIDVYLAGTNTLTTTWTTSTAAVQNSNPIVLNNGFPPNQIWLDDAVPVKFVVKDAAGNTLSTDDNIASMNALKADLASTASGKGSALVGHAQTSGTNAASTTVRAKLDEHQSPEDRGAVADNSTNNQTAFSALFALTRIAEVGPGVYRVGTGNLSPNERQIVQGSGRELSYIRSTHASNPVFSCQSQFTTYADLTVDRTTGVVGTGIRHTAVSNAAPLEGLKITNVTVNGHATGVYLRDFVLASIQDSYLQSCVTGLDVDKTGANFATMLSVSRVWIRANTTTGASIAGVVNSHFDQVAFEGSGVSTPLGLSLSGGDAHYFTSPWWEDVKKAATIVNVGGATFTSGYLNASALTSAAFYANGASTATTVIFDGSWQVQNLTTTFAQADVGATIIVRAPALLGLTFSAINGGKVIFDVPLEAAVSWNPANTATLTKTASTTVTVTGAALGDICVASFENGTSDPQNFIFKADCFSANTITVSGFNISAGALDLAVGTLTVRVQKRALIS